MINPKSESLKLCNCAGCSRELLGESMLREWEILPPMKQRLYPEPVHARLFGRPYCQVCFLELKLNQFSKRAHDEHGSPD